MKLTIETKRKSIPLEIEGNPDTIQVKHLQRELLKYFPKITLERQRIKFNDKTILENGSDKTLDSYGVKEGAYLNLKDLGPQISWKTVFLIEYLGPIIIHLLFFYYATIIHQKGFIPSKLQWLTLILFLSHFIKREFETLFVHRFSHATMPLFNLFKNSAHYHVLSGVLPAYFAYSPRFAIPYEFESINYTIACVILFLFAELSNAHTHITLRNLRPPGTKERKIPYGYGFNLVSCPNYLFETIAWIAVGFLLNHWTVWIFVTVSFGQMLLWALKKHKQYKKEFKNYPKNRKAIVPFLI